MFIPESLSKHHLFDTLPEENFPCPWSKDRIEAFQKRIDAIAGLAPNGCSNVRLIWPADSDESISMHFVNGEKRARYKLYTQEYEAIKSVNDIDVVEYLDVDITPPRFIIEQYHLPDEELFARAPEGCEGRGYYSHLWSVAHHDDKCCNGREARGAELCLGLYKEPNDRDLDELRKRIALRDAETAHRRVGERAPYEELIQGILDVKSAQQDRKQKRTELFDDAFRRAMVTHSGRLFSDNPTVHSNGKYLFMFSDRKGFLVPDENTNISTNV